MKQKSEFQLNKQINETLFVLFYFSAPRNQEQKKQIKISGFSFLHYLFDNPYFIYKNYTPSYLPFRYTQPKISNWKQKPQKTDWTTQELKSSPERLASKIYLKWNTNQSRNQLINILNTNNFRDILFERFFNSKFYDIGLMGRKRLNKKLRLNIPLYCTALTPLDFLALFYKLFFLLNSKTVFNPAYDFLPDQKKSFYSQNELQLLNERQISTPSPQNQSIASPFQGDESQTQKKLSEQ